MIVNVTLPLAGFEEVTQRGNVFFARFDKTTRGDVVDCSEISVMVEGVPTYSKLVAALVTGRYDYDSQIAMLANKDDGVEEHEAAWTEFQEWRTEAKRLARVVFPVSEGEDGDE